MPTTTAKIVFVRHGESEWNLKNLFCGWFDADLSAKGLEEAQAGGPALKNAGYDDFDIAFTSVLTRAIKTCDIMLEGAMGAEKKGNVKFVRSWRLNERHYGGLTGLDKKETVEKYGAEQVQIWRRSFDTPPPPMESDHQYYSSIREDPRYQPDLDSGSLTPETFPTCESLELTIKRTLPFWNSDIIPALQSGKKVIVAAHGNSLRGIVCHLDKMSNETIMELNLPTGIPFVYELEINEDGSIEKVVKSMEFIGDEKTVAEAIEKVKAQTGGAKK